MIILNHGLISLIDFFVKYKQKSVMVKNIENGLLTQIHKGKLKLNNLSFDLRV